MVEIPKEREQLAISDPAMLRHNFYS